MRSTGAFLLLAACTSSVASNPPADVEIEASADVVDASTPPDRVALDTPTPFDTAAPPDVVDASTPRPDHPALDTPTSLDVGGALPCTAGRIEECPCGNGLRGVQTCQPSGVYGPCVCADGGASADVGDRTDLPLAMDTAAPTDTGVPRPDVPPTNPLCPTTTVAVVTGCYTEEGCDSLCPRGRFVGRATAPSWRVTGIVISEPAALASPLILNVINPPLRDGKFLWGLSLDLTSNTFRTGALQRPFTRGVLGAGLLDGAFAYWSGNAPGVGAPNRWNPIAGTITGTSSVTTAASTNTMNLPIFNDDGSVLVELPLSNVRLLDVPVSSDRGCIGLGRLRVGRYNECSSDWDTTAGGSVEGVITVSAARGINVSALGQSLCQLISGTNCDAPMNTWTRQPDTMVGTEPGYRFTGRFAAVSADIR